MSIPAGASGGPGGFRPSGRGPHPFQRRPATPSAKPRRVVAGVRLASRDTATPDAWASQRWMRPVETGAEAAQLAEGLEYARLGQTRTLDVGPGAINARVQGRMPKAYRVEIRCATFSHEQWEHVMGRLLSQARYVASLLAGEIPANIEDVFIPTGLRLFPSEPQDLAVSCACAEKGPWCKHACCVMRLVAERLATEPLLIFAIRGLPEEDLLERVRRHRVLAGAAMTGAGRTPVYTPHLPGVADRVMPALDDCLDAFWTAGRGLEHLDLPVDPPDVSHPILRRLGPSPFKGARFPLVGLLATCYDVISEAAVAAEVGRADE